MFKNRSISIAKRYVRAVKRGNEVEASIWKTRLEEDGNQRLVTLGWYLLVIYLVSFVCSVAGLRNAFYPCLIADVILITKHVITNIQIKRILRKNISI